MRRPVGRRLRVAGTVAVALAVTTAGYAADAVWRPGGGGPLGPEPVTLLVEIEHSRFQLEPVRVRAGTEVRFVVVNDDPISHELVVGDDEVHARHATGTEPDHGAVPGEVSVAAGEIAATTYRFDEPGSVRYACHLPGHVAYGMEGVIEVVP